MSGFVASLLSRNRGTAEVVRPRLASLFEPGEPRASHLDGQPPLEQDGEEMVTSPFATLPSEQDTRLAYASHAVRSGRASQGDPRESDVLALGEFRMPARARTGAAGPPLDRQDASSEARAFASGRLAMPLNGAGVAPFARSSRASALASVDEGGTPSASALGGARHHADHGNGDSPPGSVASARTARDAAGAAHVERGGMPRGSVASDGMDRADSHPGARISTTAPAPMPASPLIPAPTPRFRFEPRASRPRASAVDPIVEINIGRIEVRAAVERGSDRKAAGTPAPVMGLDEYLKTRARGGSR